MGPFTTFCPKAKWIQKPSTRIRDKSFFIREKILRFNAQKIIAKLNC
jgi:hypothetical protein